MKKKYTQLHMKFNKYCWKKSVMNREHFLCTNNTFNGASSWKQANLQIQIRETEVEKRDYFSLVFLILGVLEYKNFAKADLYRKKKKSMISGRWVSGRWSVGWCVGGRWLSIGQLVQRQSVGRWSVVGQSLEKQSLGRKLLVGGRLAK